MKTSTVIIIALLTTIPASGYPEPGDIDPSFGDDGSTLLAIDLAAPLIDSVTDTLATPNGDIYLIGSASGLNDQVTTAVQRLGPDGMPDVTYNGGAGAFVGIAGINYFPAGAIVDTNGRLVIAATAATNGFPGSEIAICRFLPSGQPDSLGEDPPDASNCTRSLSGNSLDGVQAGAIALDGDGNILVVGTAIVNGRQVAMLIRLTPSAGFDGDFKPVPGQSGFRTIAFPNANVVGQDIAVRADGRILVGATVRPVNSFNQDFLVIALDAKGKLENGFGDVKTPGMRRIAFDRGGDRNDALKSISVLPDNSIIAAGSARIDASSRQFAVAKLASNGVLSAGFGQKGLAVHTFCDVCLQSPLADATIQSNGKIVLTGSVKGQTFEDIGVMRLLSNGSIDTGFGSQGRVFIGFELLDGENSAGPAKSAAASVSIQNGNIVIGGSTQTDPDNLTNRDFAAVRLLTN